MKRIALGGLAAIAALIVVVVGLRAFRPDVIVGPNQQIQIDDFAIALNEAQRVDDKYRLELTVFNNAQRVDFEFSPSQVLVLDEAGNCLLSECVRQPKTLHAGTNATVVLLVNDKPAYIKWQFGGTVGGLVDDLWFGDKRIRVGL